MSKDETCAELDRDSGEMHMIRLSSGFAHRYAVYHSSALNPCHKDDCGQEKALVMKDRRIVRLADCCHK
ncbi:hypothetical protein KIN20_032921 [Parelaphostrongylus tenuis]|uniref:Uncharacterized protein n=1 Tax=Parelaphostrongylus tenuis TaxID=148309 RepID=A0AAD5R7R1_PARTN|nr:hypothetical protein KIN20_032921 [Parelaphostrongylus tenuis]